jgi:hypothetical protein
MKTFKEFVEGVETLMTKDSTFGGQSDKAAANRAAKKKALFDAERERNAQAAAMMRKRKEAGKSFKA